MAFTAALPLHSRQSFGALLGRQSPRRIAGEIALGAAGLAIGGLALYFLKERSQEEAEHTVIERDGAFTVRRYARLVTAEVTRYGTIADAMDEGFRPLFDYISNKHDSRMTGATGRKIAMTVPVTVSPADKPGAWTIRFVMPRSWSRATLPEAANGVTLGERAPRTLAAVRFNGRGTDRDLIAAKRDELLAWVEKRGLQTLGEPEFAAYNAPIVPGALRRNEWWVEVGSL
ncbi:heme-binding protein [Novosphingobium sp. G106]|uniref:SOUL family heme-binding protein n=1 Tax=Novosphingobium sp. G106 TaxID=2849500 RepID=UPI001C2CFA95|nr:heme-binding protein [Novosphingobium sp. G106]MBV1690237.1 heme-binding protein [Novosphingobium sp. G106]